MTAAYRRGEMDTANQQLGLRGVGKVVENVEWGPKGRALTVARVIGCVVRTCFIVSGGLCVYLEVKQWHELRYPFPVQCFLFLVTAVGVGVTLWLILTNPSEVKKDDVLKVPPRLGVTWTWCSYCRLFCPPGSMHCFLCHRCIAGIHHHCVALWRCIGKKTLPAFITALGTFVIVMLVNFLMITEPTASFRTIGWNYVIIFPVMILLISSIWSLREKDKWNPPQTYPSSVFVMRAPQELSDTAPFTFSFSGTLVRREEAIRMTFRPVDAYNILPKARKIKDLPLCRNKKCQAVANPFWVTRNPDVTLNCNICGADFVPPKNIESALLDHLCAENDVQCLLHNDKPRPRPRLVFVLDAGFHDVKTCIHSWVVRMPDLLNVELLCYETQTCILYSDGTVREEKLKDYVSLDALVNRAWKKVASHGGRVVFLSGHDTSNLKVDLLEALTNAASNITLNMVCVGSLGVDMNPLIQPLILHHQARTKGWTRLVECSRDVINLVNSGIFTFCGVMAHGRIQWTPGIEVSKVFKRGAAHSGQSTGSFSLMCLDREDEVEFTLKVDPDTILHRRRFPDHEDNKVYFQLQILYTDLKGMKVLAVFNRMFSVDE